MKIIAVNGSPKTKGSLSERIIMEMEGFLETKIDIYHAGKLVKGSTPPEIINEVLDADTLLIVFPLYCDALPASLVELFTRLEMAAQGREHKPCVFAIVNCGFYEASQNETALAICKNFSDRTGLPWGYGLSIGGGPPLSGFKSWEKGPAAGIYAALCDMAKTISARKTGTNIFVSFGLPRFLYLFITKFNMWSFARKNKTKNLRARPYIE